jgi:hypothetical protein
MIRTSIVLNWLNKKLKYDCHWAYFSTLGGAYSSLGEDSLFMVSVTLFLVIVVIFYQSKKIIV